MSKKKSTAASLIAVLGSGAAPFVISLLTLPLLITLIGLERFGLLAIVWMITGSVGFLQFGMGRAIVQRINASHLGDGDDVEQSRQSIISTSFLLTLFSSLLAAAVGGLAFHYYCVVFDVASIKVQNELLTGLPSVFVAIFLGFWINVLLSIHQADERFARYSLMKFLNVAGNQLFPLAAAYFLSPDFNFLMAAVALSRVSTVALLAWGARKDIFSLSNSHITRERIFDLLSFGGWVSVIGIASPLLVIIDRFFIGAFFNAKLVGLYTIPYNLCSRLLIVPSSVGNVILPRLARSRDAALDRSTSQGLHLVALLITPVLIGFVMAYRPFVSVWIDPKTANATTAVATILAIGVWCNSVGQAPFAKLTGEGKVKQIAFWHLFQIPLYIVALIVLLGRFGLIGAAIAWSCRTLVDSIGLFRISRTEISWPVVFLLVFLAAICSIEFLEITTFLKLTFQAMISVFAGGVSISIFLKLGGRAVLRRMWSSLRH